MTQDSTLMSKDDPTGRDGIVAKELVFLFMSQWRWAAAAFGIVALILIVALAQVEPHWQAQATIRVGQVYDALSDSVRPIESLQDGLVRLRARAANRDVNFDLVPTNALILITVRDSSAEEAKQSAELLANYLVSVHQELMQATRSEAELLEGQYDKELSGLREVQSNLLKALSVTNNSSAENSPAALAAIARVMERNIEEISTVQRQNFLVTRRSAVQSAPTQLLGEVGATKTVSVSRSLAIAFSLIMGIAAALLAVLSRAYFTRTRVQRMSA